jgi:hypothetical protein
MYLLYGIYGMYIERIKSNIQLIYEAYFIIFIFNKILAWSKARSRVNVFIHITLYVDTIHNKYCNFFLKRKFITII